MSEHDEETTPAASERRPNRLAGSTSPYLLQHAHNPVDWYPWGEEALERARSEQKPILLSIGYAACHWCHVMEHESFEDPEIAGLMNENFICIKVDREERPDIDEIYMSAVQLLTGSGGWPMTMFLKPDLEPFYGGTYYPPEPRYGQPGMKQLIPEIARIFRERPEDVESQAGELTRAVRAMAAGAVRSDESRDGSVAGDAGVALIDRAVEALLKSHDDTWGGFGAAPKFPPSMGLSLLMRRQGRAPDERIAAAVRKSLERMALGGIYDHVGGGFARYSTDDRWLVPHFEKMLYDNALLVPVYAEAINVLGDAEGALYERTIRETLAFVARELADPGGGFYSSLDADSEGVEGKFYVWTHGEVESVLGDEADFFCRIYDIDLAGNWEDGTSIPWMKEPLSSLARDAGIEGSDEEVALAALERLAPLRKSLFEHRAGRIRPGLDDKVLTAWNGLMISAFARASQVLGDPALCEPAGKAADFVLEHLQRDGRLLRTWRQGTAHLAGYLEDYAFLAAGLIDLYETNFDTRRLTAARDLVEAALEHFSDEETGGFFFTADDHETLLARPRGVYDGAVPSGNAVMAQNLLRLSALLGRPEWRERAGRAIESIRGSLAQVPGGHHQMLAALDWWVGQPLEIAIAGGDDAESGALLAEVRSMAEPNRIVARLDPKRPGDADIVPLLAGKTMVDGKSAAYVCRDFTCRAPVTSAAALRDEIRDQSSGS